MPEQTDNRPEIEELHGSPMNPSENRPEAEKSIAAVPAENAKTAKDPNELKLTVLWKIHDYANGYIRFADGKAGMIIGYCSALVAGLLAAKVHNFMGGSPCSWGIAGWCSALALLFLGLGILCAGVTVKPRFGTSMTTGAIFWQNVLAYGKPEAYLQSVQEANSEYLVEQTAKHIYDLSAVNSAKYTWINRSMLVAMIGTLLSAYPAYRATGLKNSALNIPVEEKSTQTPAHEPNAETKVAPLVPEAKSLP